MEEQVRLQNAIATFAALAGLFEQGTLAYKIATLAKLTIDTAAAISSLTAASEANPANYLTFGGAGAAQFAAGIIRIGANIGQAISLLSEGFSEGGYTGSGGRNTPAGVVHAGEVVWNQDDVRMAGGPAAANAMRPSYTDGGIVAAASSRSSAGMNQSAPIVYLSYAEFREFSNSVHYKESMATV